MTHAVVPSDIDVAKGLIDAGCEDSGIVAVLCQRGVDAAKAASLVYQLRQGERIELETCLAPVAKPLSSPHSHRRNHRKKTKRHRRSTIPKMCDASNEPLYFLYDRRPGWRRILKRTLRWTMAAIVTCVVSCSLSYVSYEVWRGARENAERFQSKNPNYRDRRFLSEHGLPDIPADNLKKQLSPD